MALPIFPLDLQHVLLSLDTMGTRPCWNINRTSHQITLSCQWYFPGKKDDNFDKPRKPPLKVSTKKNSKRKSPSRLARDKRRLQEFQAKKKSQQDSQKGQSVPLSSSESVPPTPAGNQPEEEGQFDDLDPPSPAAQIQTHVNLPPIAKLNKKSTFSQRNATKFLTTHFGKETKLTLASGTIYDTDGNFGIKRLGPPPKISIGISIDQDTTLSLKEKIADELNLCPSIPASCFTSENIIIDRIVPVTHALDHIGDIADDIPVSELILEKKAPKFQISYDLKIFHRRENFEVYIAHLESDHQC